MDTGGEAPREREALPPTEETTPTALGLVPSAMAGTGRIRPTIHTSQGEAPPEPRKNEMTHTPGRDLHQRESPLITGRAGRILKEKGDTPRGAIRSHKHQTAKRKRKCCVERKPPTD